MTKSINHIFFCFIFPTAWHLRLRQYYPGQEVINEHNDPNLAETPHYKEKQTILPNPLSAEQHIEKKVQTPVKRTHDGKIKKEKKDPYKSPISNEESSPKEVCIKSDEAKIDMRKMIIDHKTHKKHTESGASSTSKTHSSSSSTSLLNHSKKEKSKHKSHSSDSHRSHSSKKSSSHSSNKSGRNESRKSSSSSNHSSLSSEKHKSSSSSTEISSKKVESSKVHATTSQPVNTSQTDESTLKNDKIKSSELIKVASPVQVSSSLSNPPASPPQSAPESQIHNLTPCVTEPTIQSPPFNLLPPLPIGDMPVEIPPPPPPPPPPLPLDDERPSMSKNGISPDSSTQQMPSSPAPKVRKVNSTEKPATNSDLLGSIMASMGSPRNGSSI